MVYKIRGMSYGDSVISFDSTHPFTTWDDLRIKFAIQSITRVTPEAAVCYNHLIVDDSEEVREFLEEIN